MDCSPLGSSVHGILPARILEWVESSSWGSSQHKDPTQVSRVAGGFFKVWSNRETQELEKEYTNEYTNLKTTEMA